MFDSFGTEGLSLFTWIVAGLLGLVVALVTSHVMTVMQEDKEIEEHENTEDNTKKV
ncbi:hypothetical protein OKW21_003584 [Catalinimonas alkaloidigena]|uniref:hypothetical protein n=1 Tax=Catalinimonas alkaloidigena TaxID=1075417 RepID=UPI002405EF0E|nr:hypothetical protein [Catalinimonas alkaloidigena]MDF9798321.1 hypothetical protein [Catalinimonas alkaloidigena]